MSFHGDDPGWGRSARHALLGLIPGFLSVQLRRAQAGEGLVVLRGLFVSFLVALGLVGVVVLILEVSTPGFGTLPEFPAMLVVIGVGALSSAAPLLLRRDLSCEDDEQLAKSYVQRFFLRVAFAELSALMGFVGFIVSGAGWMYLLGAVFSAIGFARFAPTAERLRREQEELTAAGCHRSLLAVLQRHPPRRR